jgi:hypothetical protein
MTGIQRYDDGRHNDAGLYVMKRNFGLLNTGIFAGNPAVCFLNMVSI